MNARFDRQYACKHDRRISLMHAHGDRECAFSGGVFFPNMGNNNAHVAARTLLGRVEVRALRMVP